MSVRPDAWRVPDHARLRVTGGECYPCRFSIRVLPRGRTAAALPRSRGCETFYRLEEGLSNADADRRSALTERRRMEGVRFAWSRSRTGQTCPGLRAILRRSRPCPEASVPRMTQGTGASSPNWDALTMYRRRYLPTKLPRPGRAEAPMTRAGRH